MTDERSLPDLARRLGPEEYRARRALEKARHVGEGNRHSSLLAAVSAHLSPVLRGIFRLAGLHGIAYRQFHHIRLRRNVVRLARLPPELDGFRILHLSDLHLDLDPAFTDTLIARLHSLTCDLCVITGDFRNLTVDHPDHFMEHARRLIPHVPRPAFAVLGNHDSLDMVAPFEARNIRFLLNENTWISRGKGGFSLVGIDDPNIYKTHNLERAMRGAPEGAVRVLLSHSPAIHPELERYGIDLVLTGHTHGGQICLPGGRILLRNDPSPVRMLRGAWRHGTTRGYTSGGTGACGAPLRLNCPAEIALHTLRRG